MQKADDHLRVVATNDGSRTLESVAFGQAYGSQHGAAAEARHVFLEGAGVQARLTSGLETQVLEVGLGTGLNFLLTADAALQAGAALTYRAFEWRLPPAGMLAELTYGTLLKSPGLWDAWLAWAREVEETMPSGGVTAVSLAGVQLEVAWGDAWPDHRPSPGAADLLARGPVDAVYHDAFSPQANPALWEEAFLHALASALRPGGRLATYSVAGRVRRALQDCGLATMKAPGPTGGKAEMLQAVKPERS